MRNRRRHGIIVAALTRCFQCHEWHDLVPVTALFIFPFAAFTGGLAQFVAGLWACRARDSLATAMLGIWGAFWIAYGVLFLLFATGTLVQPTGAFLGLGIWLVPLALITYAGAAAATASVGRYSLPCSCSLPGQPWVQPGSSAAVGL